LPPQPEITEKVTEVEIDEMCLILKKKAKESGFDPKGGASQRCIVGELNDLSAGISVVVMRLN
jgi:hypothetical protein